MSTISSVISKLHGPTPASSTSDEEVEAISDAVSHASAGELAKAIPTFEHTRALNPQQRQMLRLAVNQRVQNLAKSGEGRGALGAMLARNAAEHKAETVGLFSEVTGSAMPSLEALQSKVTEWVGIAQANQVKLQAKDSAPPQVTPQSFKNALRQLIGINSGPDEIASVHASDFVEMLGRREPGVYLGIDAFDAAGYHVMHCETFTDTPGVLAIAGLVVTHGRNVMDLNMLEGESKVPGRGNARLVSQAFESTIEAALAQGFTKLMCVPGGPTVAKLYHQMGFRFDDPELAESMTLDLTDRASIEQIVFVFAASREGIKDVPKNVSERLSAKGEWLSLPAMSQENVSWPFLRADGTEAISLVGGKAAAKSPGSPKSL